MPPSFTYTVRMLWRKLRWHIGFPYTMPCPRCGYEMNWGHYGNIGWTWDHFH